MLLGWDVDAGCPSEGGLQPDLLVSLFVPKKGAETYRGRHHYLAGRCMPADLAKKFLICLPPYPSTDYCVPLRVKRGEDGKEEPEDRENQEPSKDK